MTENYLESMQQSSHISGNSAAYVDALYESYLKDPNSVSDEWRNYFNVLPEVKPGKPEVSHEEIRNYFRQQAKIGPVAVGPGAVDQRHRDAHVMRLINAYRSHGHHHAVLDPMGMAQRKHIPDLQLEHHQLSDADLQSQFNIDSPLTGKSSTLANIIESLRKTYCDTVGVEFMHITDNEQTDWLIDRIESVQSHPTYSAEIKKRLLQKLTAAEGLEKYLHTKFVGQKRFSLEGGESLIPMLDELVQRAGSLGVKETVIGMAHRGRLNVLVNILGKAPSELFDEFAGKKREELRTGDVKYHMGFSSDVETAGGNLHLSLSFNPSHLEIIAPVVQGSVRARMRRHDDLVEKKQVLPVVIHGDAAFAGQGVVMETFNFSQARGYSTGGTVHIVVNNQIGFTTSNPIDARSTLYCTDVAKIVQAPVFHVNAEDPEAVLFVGQLALDFRQRFKKDVVIDLVCYRRHGHNEADEPAVTQPLMYKTIRAMNTTRQVYAERLIAEKNLTATDAKKMVDDFRDELDAGHPVVKTLTGALSEKYAVDWQPYLNKDWDEPTNTACNIKKLKALAIQLETLPETLNLHSQVKKVVEDRRKMTAGELPVNWGYAETLAYATLIEAGYPVRLSGQDSGRGTFAHRHAVLHDAVTGDSYIPLQHISKKPDEFVVIDSVLSEEAVLGFEYGFASSEPNALTIWEAQFGDFVNGAQVVTDQFIASGEQKWGRLCGMVMLLPHGMEGQGPEHSSARLERYLQLCAQHNMQVCVPTTPAQAFHMFRRQMIRPMRKPLVVMSPKSLLRHKAAVSTFEELATGEFQVVIPETEKLDSKKVRRVVLCSGKVYYDLFDARVKKQQTDVALIRIEQLYPFPEKVLNKVLKPYQHVTDIVWCQEEPKNQGAWFSSQHHIRACLSDKQHLNYAGRDFFASPAVGSASLHMEQQNALVDEALA